MKSIYWNYSLCVTCGKCIKTCQETLGQVMCSISPVLNNDEVLYNWKCDANSVDNSLLSKCKFACKYSCPQSAIS